MADKNVGATIKIRRFPQRPLQLMFAFQALDYQHFVTNQLSVKTTNPTS